MVDERRHGEATKADDGVVPAVGDTGFEARERKHAREHAKEAKNGDGVTADAGAGEDEPHVVDDARRTDPARRYVPVLARRPERMPLSPRSSI